MATVLSLMFVIASCSSDLIATPGNPATPASTPGIETFIPQSVGSTVLDVTPLSDEELAVQFREGLPLGEVFRDVYGDVPGEGAVGTAPNLQIFVFRTPFAAWSTFAPAYEARVLRRPRPTGVETRTEVVRIGGTKALLGEITDTDSGLKVTAGVVGPETLVYLVQGVSREDVLATLGAILDLCCPAPPDGRKRDDR
jgi:hypothetical protein